MQRISRNQRKVTKTRRANRVEYIMRNPSNGHEINHDPYGKRNPEACRQAIARKGIQPGTKVRLVGEAIPRSVEEVLADYRVKLFGFFQLVYPTELEVIS